MDTKHLMNTECTSEIPPEGSLNLFKQVDMAEHQLKAVCQTNLTAEFPSLSLFSEETHLVFAQHSRSDQVSRSKGEPGHEVYAIISSGEEDRVSDRSVKDLVGTLEKMLKNGATTKETVDSFKKSTKFLQDLDATGLEGELAKGVKNSKINSLHLLVHLKEALQSSGFKVIGYRADHNEGGFSMKNDKTDTYISVSFSREKGKESAFVQIAKNKVR